MQIKKVSIEGLHKVAHQTYEFDTANYIYGPNGAGKSTILQAIQLGLLGYIPGTNKTSSAIFSHSNSNEMQITIFLNQDEDDICVTRTFTKHGSKIDEDLSITPSYYDLEKLIGDLELPILNFNAFLALTANKQKDLMMSIIPGADQEIDTAGYLKSLESYRHSAQSVVDEVSSSIPKLKNIDDVKELNAQLKTLSSNLTAEEKRITATVQSLIFYDDYSGPTDIEAIKSEINELMIQRDHVLQQEASKEHYDQIKLRMETDFKNLADNIEEDAEYLKSKQLIQECEEIIEECQSGQIKLEDEIIELKSKHNQNTKILSSDGVCPFIEDICDRISDQLSTIESKDNELISIINSKQVELQAIKERTLKAKDKIERLKRFQNDLTSKYTDRDSVKSLLHSLEMTGQAEDSGISSSELSIKLQQLNDDLVKASANVKYNELMEVVQKQKLELVPQIDFAKSAVKATGENGLQSEIMESPFAKVESIMQSIISKSNLDELGQPKFKLEAKANSFNFGFMRDKFIPFELLSSGEKCIFTLIFMLSILESVDSELSFIMIDDLFDHLDDHRFKTIITNINNLSESAQIIVAGVKEPSDAKEVNLIYVGD